MSFPLLAVLGTDEAGRFDASSKALSLTRVARALARLLSDGQAVSRRTLGALMSAGFHASDASGAWSMRDAYDALEVGQLLAFLDRDAASFPSDPYAMLRSLQAAGRALPTQTYRSERQIDLQQFSTPMPLAWLAARAAAIGRNDIVLEPSAGTGMLAIHARRAGAKLLLNERDPLRAALLADMLDQSVTSHDAEFIDDLLPPGLRPNVVLINPPFARSEGRGSDRHAGARHLPFRAGAPGTWRALRRDHVAFLCTRWDGGERL